VNSDQFQGQWLQVKGSIKQQWGKLTDDDLIYIGGTRDNLVGRIQERYGIVREEADRRVKQWMDDRTV
jgi:uncharacterized protein YjbJ (UPF0337 family)